MLTTEGMRFSKKVGKRTPSGTQQIYESQKFHPIFSKLGRPPHLSNHFFSALPVHTKFEKYCLLLPCQTLEIYDTVCNIKDVQNSFLKIGENVHFEHLSLLLYSGITDLVEQESVGTAALV